MRAIEQVKAVSGLAEDGDSLMNMGPHPRCNQKNQPTKPIPSSRTLTDCTSAWRWCWKASRRVFPELVREAL